MRNNQTLQSIVEWGLTGFYNGKIIRDILGIAGVKYFAGRKGRILDTLKD